MKYIEALKDSASTGAVHGSECGYREQTRLIIAALPLIGRLQVYWRLIMKELYEGYARFVLGELHTNDKNPLIFFGVNPSTATPGRYDPTIDEVIAISKANNHDSWIMLNVYPQIATDINDLPNVRDQKMHEKNIDVIKKYVKDGSTVIAGWGNLIEKKDYLITCLKDIVTKLNGIDIHWHQIGDLTENKNPTHPRSLQYLEEDKKLEKRKDLRDFEYKSMEDYIDKKQGQTAV
jgi:hypothetical protein